MISSRSGALIWLLLKFVFVLVVGNVNQVVIAFPDSESGHILSFDEVVSASPFFEAYLTNYNRSDEQAVMERLFSLYFSKELSQYVSLIILANTLDFCFL